MQYNIVQSNPVQYHAMQSSAIHKKDYNKRLRNKKFMELPKLQYLEMYASMILLLPWTGTVHAWKCREEDVGSFLTAHMLASRYSEAGFISFHFEGISAFPFHSSRLQDTACSSLLGVIAECTVFWPGSPSQYQGASISGRPFFIKRC